MVVATKYSSNPFNGKVRESPGPRCGRGACKVERCKAALTRCCTQTKEHPIQVNLAGNGLKAMVTSLEHSLKRLQTDYGGPNNPARH